MTNDLFWELHESGRILVKAFTDNNGGEIDAFEYGGKYYLRFSLRSDAISWNGKKKIVMKNGWIRCFIKEFNSKEHANNYFKRASSGFKRVC